MRWTTCVVLQQFVHADVPDLHCRVSTGCCDARAAWMEIHVVHESRAKQERLSMSRSHGYLLAFEPKNLIIFPQTHNKTHTHFLSAHPNLLKFWPPKVRVVHGHTGCCAHYLGLVHTGCGAPCRRHHPNNGTHCCNECPHTSQATSNDLQICA